MRLLRQKRVKQTWENFHQITWQGTCCFPSESLEKWKFKNVFRSEFHARVPKLDFVGYNSSFPFVFHAQKSPEKVGFRNPPPPHAKKVRFYSCHLREYERPPEPEKKPAKRFSSFLRWPMSGYPRYLIFKKNETQCRLLPISPPNPFARKKKKKKIRERERERYAFCQRLWFKGQQRLGHPSFFPPPPAAPGNRLCNVAHRAHTSSFPGTLFPSPHIQIFTLGAGGTEGVRIEMAKREGFVGGCPRTLFFFCE